MPTLPSIATQLRGEIANLTSIRDKKLQELCIHDGALQAFRHMLASIEPPEMPPVVEVRHVGDDVSAAPAETADEVISHIDAAPAPAEEPLAAKPARKPRRRQPRES